MSQSSSPRLHNLDALRGGALILGIFFHAAFSFFPGDQLWLVMDTQRSGALSGSAFTLHIFRMTIFFLIAGYFGRMQLYRLTPGPFARDRLKRIGIPLVAFWPIMMVCFVILAIWGMVSANGGTMPENAPPPPPMSLATFPLTHLWFLYMLLFLYLVTFCVRGLLSILGLKAALGALSDNVLRLLAPLGVLPLLLAIPTAIAFVFQANWHPYFGIPTPEYGFIPNRVAVIAYGGAFALGWLLQRQPEHLARVTKYWPVYLVAAVGLSAYCLSVIGVSLSYFQPLNEETKLPYAAAYAAAIWLWTFGLVGLCMKFWSQESPFRRYIADASYWLYLIHLPIIMALQIWVSQWSWPAEVKYAIILTIAIPLMLISYEFLVRYTFIGGVLNGRKRQNPRKMKEVTQ